MTAIAGFKAYDLRGRIPTELYEDVAYRVGRGTAEFLKPRRICVGRDIRLSSQTLATALMKGLTQASTSSTSACAAPRACTSPPPT